MKYSTRVTLIISTLSFFVWCENGSARPVCETHPDAKRHEDITSSIPCRKTHFRFLKFLEDTEVPDFQRFVAADNFREGQPPTELQITWIGSNFRKHFLNKIEEKGTSRQLDVYRLMRFAPDDAIINDIGGSIEVMLHDVWTLLIRQSRGERGPLRTDATPNVFYIRDSQGLLWAVDVVWSGAGWEIGASKLDDPRLWNHGINIISH